MWNTAGASVMRGSVCVSVCECVCVWWRGSKVESGGGQHWGRCSAQPAGSSAGESHSPCQQPTGPIREEFGLHPCMQIRAEVEGIGRGSRLTIRSAHIVLPEQVKLQLEGRTANG